MKSLVTTSEEEDFVSCLFLCKQMAVMADFEKSGSSFISSLQNFFQK